MKKIRWGICFIFFIVIYISLIQFNGVNAITQTLSSDINALDDKEYPGFKQLINNLKNQYPNWDFKILYTDLEWNDVIANEYTGHEASPKNLVNGSSSNYSGSWICSICGVQRKFDNGSWNCASEIAIKYMMDPRNSINASDVFQFLELSYSDVSIDNLRPMVVNTFLNNDSYLNAILESSKNNNVNPYYVVARIIQEQGKTGSTTISGTYGGYEGYYNIFNFNASGNSKSEILANALGYAKRQGWTSMELSISGGIAKVASGYIARGQNTLYFQKFDVENSDGNLYWHQYMQNLLAAQGEGTTLRKQFNNIGAISGAYTFIIPVYKNMPENACQRPSTASNNNSSNSEITTDLLTVNVNNTLSLRDAPGGNRMGLYLYKDEIVTRLEKATEKVYGTYWDKVMKSNGTIGYVARETYEDESTYKLYLIPINNETSSEDKISNIIDTPLEDNNTTIPINPIENNNSSNEKVNKGDIDNNGFVDAMDMYKLIQFILGNIQLTEQEQKIVDYNEDQKIDAMDMYLMIQKIIKE